MKDARPKRPTKPERIDQLLVQCGLADTRTKAQALIMAGLVLVNEQRVNKPSQAVPADARIRIKGDDDPASRYVGRGGVKLETALREFAVDVNGLRCLDVGASTGGFTTVFYNTEPEASSLSTWATIKLTGDFALMRGWKL